MSITTFKLRDQNLAAAVLEQKIEDLSGWQLSVSISPLHLKCLDALPDQPSTACPDASWVANSSSSRKMSAQLAYGGHCKEKLSRIIYVILINLSL